MPISGFKLQRVGDRENKEICTAIAVIRCKNNDVYTGGVSVQQNLVSKRLFSDFQAYPKETHCAYSLSAEKCMKCAFQNYDKLLFRGLVLCDFASECLNSGPVH